jgi:hypothetical protein
LLAVAQMFLPWMQVKFRNPRHPGDGYDWSGTEVGSGLEVLVAGLLVLALVWRGNWRERPAHVLGGVLGGVILYYAGRSLLHLRDFVDQANAVVGPNPPGSGYFVGPGAYVAVTAGLLALLGGVVGVLATRRPMLDPRDEPIYHSTRRSTKRPLRCLVRV